jgi:hypothetical protein
MKEKEFQKERTRKREGKKGKKGKKEKIKERRGRGRPVLVNNPGASRLLGYRTSNHYVFSPLLPSFRPSVTRLLTGFGTKTVTV